MNPDSVVKGIQGIKNYLAEKGVLQTDGLPLPVSKSHEMYFAESRNRKKYYAIAGGMIQSGVKLDTQVKVGERLYFKKLVIECPEEKSIASTLYQSP